MNYIINNINIYFTCFAILGAMSSFQNTKIEIDSNAAVSIGYKKFVELYGKERIDKELPIFAKLVGDSAWGVSGTFVSKPQLRNGKLIYTAKGGAAYIIIRKSDGIILQFGHGK